MSKLGYKEDGDCQLVLAVLKFTRMLLEQCGNRSIYASSSHLSSLLGTTYQSVVNAALQVSLELAKRYQASVRRLQSPTRQINNALLANHYNIELDRVHQLAQPFVKTPIISKFADLPPTTPTASAGKDKVQGTGHKNVASMFANNLVSIAAPDHADKGQWSEWGNLKITYYPSKTEGVASVATAAEAQSVERGPSSVPMTPTPLRRSSTGPTQTPRSNRTADESHLQRTPITDNHSGAFGPKTLEIRQSVVQSTSFYELLKQCPADMPKNSQYEFLNRLRICKAMLGTHEARQQALAGRLLAITNLAYIHVDGIFIDKAMKQDNDEPRRYQLVYQLAELIHPTEEGVEPFPLWLQSIAMASLEAIFQHPAKSADVLSALNATVNHGVLMYVLRKAVAGIKEDERTDVSIKTEEDTWFSSLFSLTLHIALNPKVGTDMPSAGLMEVLFDILKQHTAIAISHQPMTVSFLDSIAYQYPQSIGPFNSCAGLDVLSRLLVRTVDDAKRMLAAGHGTKPELHTQVVDYSIPYYQQQTLKWILKFIHHAVTGTFAWNTNTDRMLRNLVDNSQVLGSLRSVIEEARNFGFVVWTGTANILSDFINQDPTSFAAISESGLIQSFLGAITGRPVTVEQPQHPDQSKADRGENEEPDSPAHSDESVTLEKDERPHPPTQEMLEASRDRPLAQGVLPSSDAIQCIPAVLNSFSLNNLGMKMVVSSRALESYLEIFESHAHIRVMEAESHLAEMIGQSFDELARHHPALRPAISNAIMDMVARVNYLAKTKLLDKGVKLQVAGLQGNAIPADHTLLNNLTATQKGKAPAVDSDVEMADASSAEDSKPQGEPQSSAATTNNDDIKPHILAVSTFLSSLITNAHLKSAFVKEGGIELLLDLSEAPSIPLDFGKPMSAQTLGSAASQVLGATVSQYIESSQIIGIPSLFNRINACLDTLQVLVDGKLDHPVFRSFVVPGRSFTDENGDWDMTAVESASTGTEVARALLKLENLIKILCHCFPISQRHPSPALTSVNVYDYYIKLVKRLGPLLRGILQEELAIVEAVPQHWHQIMLAILGNGEGDGKDVGEADGESGARAAKKLTSEEQSSVEFQNFATLYKLLHQAVPSMNPFFGTIGRTLLPRRGPETYVRARHLDIAEALAQTLLGLLKPLDGELTPKALQYWNVILNLLDDMLVNPKGHVERLERQPLQLMLPTLVAFKELGGFEVTNDILLKFKDIVCNAPTDQKHEMKLKQERALTGMKEILDVYSKLVNGKTIQDSMGLNMLFPRSAERTKEFPLQLIVELRTAILPVVSQLWSSEFVEKSDAGVVTKLIDIMKTIAVADNETQRNSKSSPVFLFKDRESARFNWSAQWENLKSLVRTFPDEDLAREAIYRANGKMEDSMEYCRAHQKGLAGKRNPIPDEDAYQGPPSPKPGESQNDAAVVPDTAAADQMALGAMPDLNRLIGDAVSQAVLGEPGDHTSDDSSSNDTSSQADAHETTGAPSALATAPVATTEPVTETLLAPKETLDALRDTMLKDLIDTCLEVIRTHPDLVFEVSDLIKDTLLKADQSKDKQVELGDILASALMSFTVNDDEEKKANGKSIAAYAHLLSLLLQISDFAKAALPSVKEHISDYLTFLKLPPTSSSEPLPPWVPYILLIFETLLAEDAQPVACEWKPPKEEDQPIDPPVWVAREPNVSDEDRNVLLTTLLNFLPRIGRHEDSLALSVVRILVILTRDHAVAKIVGERQNLSRLFVMAKQQCSGGSTRMKHTRIADSIMIIIRHIVEDDDTIRQVMQTEIRQYIAGNGASGRNPRSLDIKSYLRHLSHLALRSPKLFVEVSTDLLKLTTRLGDITKLLDTRQTYTVMLKEQLSETPAPAPPKDSSVEPAVQATEDLTINDVKPSTEPADKEMTDVPKTPAQELKRPVLENPDGVVHFLLCELLNYQKVHDKESTPGQDTKAEGEVATPTNPATPVADAASLSGDEQASEVKEKDKKSHKPGFKAEEHPIFVYRCFLLNCLTELLQSYNRAKIEFINFKRNAPIQTPNTPVKPRTSVLNYLLSDVIIPTRAIGHDTLVGKKKEATSKQATAMLVALVARTSEKPLDRNREKYEYDDEPDLLFVRRFVLDTILRAYKEASASNESAESRYERMVGLAELMGNMIGEKESDSANTGPMAGSYSRSQAQIKRLMYEKHYLPTLTASIADIDLTFPRVKKVIRHILRVLRALAKTASELSQSNIITAPLTDQADDDLISTSSVSDHDDDREETPDLYRNSTLGMLEPRDEDSYSEDSEGEDDEMDEYDEYPDGMEYEDEMSQDGEDNPSDEDEEELGEMGEIEGLPGQPGVVEVIMGDDDDEDMDEDMDEDDEDDEPTDEDDDEDVDSEDIDDDGEVEIVDEDGNAIDDDGDEGWESDTDDEEDEENQEEIDYESEAQELREQAAMQGYHDDLDRSQAALPTHSFDELYPDEGEGEGRVSLFSSFSLSMVLGRFFPLC